MYKVLAFFACLALAAATEVNQCADGSALPLEVRIEGCDAMPCTVVLDSTIGIEADGISERELDNLMISVISTRPDGTITNVPIPDNNACNLIVDGSCPIAAGTPITIASSLFVNPIFPTGETELEVRLTMGTETLICFSGPIVIEE